MNMKRTVKWVGRLTVLSTAMYMVGAYSGSIENSAHDFSQRGWSDGQICVPCHAPHTPEEYITDEAPLWNHEITSATFTMYTSPTFDATQSTRPDGVSLLCLSCHDGTVALDAYGGDAGTAGTIGDQWDLGTDLRNDHPISIIYDSALAVDDDGLHDPIATTDVVIGDEDIKGPGTINDLLLYDEKVQCSSCHDVHNKYTVESTVTGESNKLLKITLDGSALCLTCHDK